MGVREKVALVLTAAVLVFQIMTSHSVPCRSKTDALQHYLDARGIKTPKAPFVTSDIKMNKNALTKKSIIKAFNFPETEYPTDASNRDFLRLGTKPNTYSFGSITKEVPNLQSKAIKDLKKDIRMKRKLDKIHENYQPAGEVTAMTNLLTGPESIRLTDNDMFPEVQYPLNAMETWAPHYWNPPLFKQNEVQYEVPAFRIFNQKISDKINKSPAPYKKQLKSKVKQFMEEIDILNEKMHSSITQSKKTREVNSNKNTTTVVNDSFEGLLKPDSNNSTIKLLDYEVILNKTTDILHYNINNDLVNISPADVKQVEGPPIEPTNHLSPQKATSNLQILEVLPIPNKTHEGSKCPKMKNSNATNDAVSTFKVEENCSTSEVTNITNTSEYLEGEQHVEEVEIPIQLRSIVQSTTMTAKNDDISSLNQNYNDSGTLSNADLLNDNTSFTKVTEYDQTSIDHSIQKNKQISNVKEFPRTIIIVVPVNDTMNMMQIPFFAKNTGSSIIVFMPTTKTLNDTLHMSPLINETHTMTSDANSMTLDFEMLPNNSMCHILPNEFKSTSLNNFTRYYNVDTVDGHKTHNITNLDENQLEFLFPNLINLSTQMVPCDIIFNSSFIDDYAVNTASSADCIDKSNEKQISIIAQRLLLDNVLNNYTGVEPTQTSANSSIDATDISSSNTDKSELFSKELHIPDNITDFIRNSSLEAVDKILHEKALTYLEKIYEYDKIDDSKVLYNTTHNKHFEGKSQLQYIKDNETSLEGKTFEYPQDIISKHLQIPIHNDSNSLNNISVADHNSYKGIDNSYVNKTEEEQPNLPESIEIPVLDSNYSRNELSESSDRIKHETFSENKSYNLNKSDEQLVEDQSISKNRIINLTKDVQVGRESVTLEAATGSFNIIKQTNSEDVSSSNDTKNNVTSIIEHVLQRNPCFNSTEDNIRKDKEVKDAAFSNDEQSLLDNDKLSDQIKFEDKTEEAINLVQNGTLTVPEIVNDTNDTKSISKASKQRQGSSNINLQNPLESNKTSTHSFISDNSNPTMRNVTDVAEDDMFLESADTLQREAIDTESLFDIPTLSDVNKTLESLSVNGTLTDTTPNNISAYNMMTKNESKALLNSNDKAVQETHDTDISQELITIPIPTDKTIPDNFSEGHERLLVSNVSEYSESDTKGNNTLENTALSDIGNVNPVPVDTRMEIEAVTGDNIGEYDLKAFN